MAQAGVGKSVVGVGEQNVPEELKPLPIAVGPQSLQRSQREDLYYGQQPQNGRGVSMSSPANSLGTESLVTPNTTPEPSGSPRTLDQEPLVLPPPTISTPYDRYMQTPPMNVPPYMAYPFYSQPTVYLVHPPVSYIPHPMEPVHMSYDLSVPPPNLSYMPMASHMFPHSMYKMSPQERFVSYEQTPSQMTTASPLGSAAAPQVPQSNEVILAAQQAETPISEFVVDQQHFPQTSSRDDHHLDNHPVQESQDDGGVVEITEIIEEIQIIEQKTETVDTVNNVGRWNDAGTGDHTDGSGGNGKPHLLDNVVHHKVSEVNNNPPPHRDDHHRDAYQNHRDNQQQQRYRTNNRRDRNFREASNSRYEHDRRSVTPDKRGYRGGNSNYRTAAGAPPAPRDDRRFSNPEHGVNQYRPKRSRDFRGDYENPGGSRENSAVRRGDNRNRYFASPRREDEYHRYDGNNVRRTGSYRNDDPMKPVPRGRPDRERTDSTQRNNRRPPVASRQAAGGSNVTRSRGSDDDSLEFLLPSAVGVKEPLDVKRMISEEAVSMNCIASQKPSRQEQFTRPAVGRKANRHLE